VSEGLKPPRAAFPASPGILIEFRSGSPDPKTLLTVLPPRAPQVSFFSRPFLTRLRTVCIEFPGVAKLLHNTA
jgi:hypothetical protein